jgi:predicted alpha/beta hydrolase
MTQGPGFRQEIIASDGQRIVAHFFLPQQESKGAVLVVPAMGTGQEYYAPFAEWLAKEGFAAATFDYRGTGLSRPAALRGFKADIFDWARLDCTAMLEAILTVAPAKPLFWIGHSLGGQILPFVLKGELISKAVIVAAGSGYWRENSAPLRRRVWWLLACRRSVGRAMVRLLPRQAAAHDWRFCRKG